MDYFFRRQQRRLIEDLIDLQNEKDLHRRYQSFVHNFKGLERQRFESEDNDEHRTYHHRGKEYCLITFTYRGSNSRRKHLDEIMIIQHNRTVFKGCLQYGDQLTFKSKRYRNESQIKLKFFINELLEEEMIGCCEYGLRNQIKRKNLFEVDHIVGSTPCYKCESDSELSTSSSSTLRSPSRPFHFPKITISRSLQRSSSILSEDEYDIQDGRDRQSTRSTPRTLNKKASSEGFPADIAEVSDYVTQLTNRFNNRPKSEEDSDVLPSTPPVIPKRRYGPPQLSMISVSEAPDTPSPNPREQTPSYLFNSTSSSSHLPQHPDSQSNSNLGDSHNTASPSNRSTEYFQSIPTNAENIPGNQRTTVSSSDANEMAIANDATQMLLARLGILRQQQVEHPEPSHGSTLREQGNVEYFAIVYLHTSYPDDAFIKQLRSLVNFMKIFNDVDDCVALINSIFQEKILLIVSNSFLDSILPRIGELQQIYKIYILRENEDEISLPSEQSKIQGLYSNITDICEDMTNDIDRISRDLITYLSTSTNTTSLGLHFVYTQLVSEILLEKNEMENSLKDLIHFSREEYDGNDEELKIIEEFENTYQKTQAIYWFSRRCFISKMVNKALRIPEADVLYKIRIFIQDLFQQIENESTTSSLTVYLGQTIQRNDLDDLQKDILEKNLMTFPQFLFGSTDQSRAIKIAKQIPVLSENYIPVLICLEIPEGFKCANTNSLRQAPDEDNDVLLNMNTMGRLVKIEKDNISDDQIACVYLTLVRCNEQRNIQDILDPKRAEVKSFSPFASVVKLMIIMNQQASAEKMCEGMFDDDSLKEDINIQSSIAASLHTLATSRRNQNEFQRAVELYLLSLNTFLRVIVPNALELSTLYINIATMYFRLDTYEKSLEYYQKAIDIHIHSNTPDLYCVSNCTNSMGIVHLKQGKYPEAVKAFERTLKILQQIPDSHESETALTYDNLGDAYLSQAKYEEALVNYSKSLEIQEQVEPRNPQNLGTSYHTIGNIFLKLGRCKEALSHLQRALEYQRQYLSVGHPAFALLYNNIGLMHYRVEEYNEALQCYAKSLEIATVALPENHTLIGITLFNVALVYSSQDKYDEAIESIEKSTVQFLKTLPPDHPDVVENNSYIESIKRKKMLKELFNENSTNF